MLPLNNVSQGKYKVQNIDAPLTHDMSKIVPRVAESAHGERSTQLPEVHNSNSEPEPTMSRLYRRSSDVEASLRPRTNKLCSTSDAQTTHNPARSPRRLSQVPLCQLMPTPSSQTLMNQSPCENSSTIAHSKSVLRSTSHDGTMKPVKPPNYSAVRLHQSALVARCSPVPDRKRGDEAVQEELHSPTFPPVLGMCQMNAIQPPLTL